MSSTRTNRRNTLPFVDRPAWLTDDVWPFPVTSIGVDGTRVAVTDSGDGPTLLFVNGGQWSFVWRDVLRELSGSFRCVTLDPPGFGLSERVDRDRQNLAALRDAVGAVIDQLDLSGVTLVMHDLGGVTSLAAAATRAERIDGLVAVNTFGWRPTGALLPVGLRLFGSAAMRVLDGALQFLPVATAAGFRHFDRTSRKTFRRGFDGSATQAMHRLFASARAKRSPELYTQIDGIFEGRLAHAPLLTIFGAWGDYLRFQPIWRRVRSDVRQVKVARGLHFPMVDNPQVVADAIAEWHAETVSKDGRGSTRG